jgi:KilA-N domain
MTDSIVRFVFDDNTIRNDGLVNITALASAYYRSTGKRKKAHDWLHTNEAKESIAYLERAAGITEAHIVVTENGIGTWVHPDLAEIFAQWISVEYRFAVVQLIRTAKENQIAAPPKPVKPPRQLAPQRDLIDYIEAAKSIGIDRDPILLSLFSQRMAEQLGGSAIAPTQQTIVTARAHELGYSAKQIGNGSALGSFVKKQGCKSIGVTKHGKYDVNVYDITPELDSSIHAYFS